MIAVKAQPEPLLPKFSKEFSGNTVPGGVVTLTFTIDNAGNMANVSALNFTDTLPSGVTVATPPNASTTCVGGTLTATAGSGIITYSGGSVAAGSTCTISVDVTASTAGLYTNTTGDLTSSAGNSGTATANLTVEEPELDITLTDTVSYDPSMDQIANPDDSIKYTLEIKNLGDTSFLDLEIKRSMDPNTTLDPSTIQATPVAINDEYELMGSPMNVPGTMGMLVNDADINDPLPNPPFNTNLTVTEVQGSTVGSSQPTENGGTVTVQSDGSFVYDSTGVAMATADSFFYKIVDSEGFTDSAKVIVFWTRPPVAKDDGITATINMMNNYPANALFNDNGSGSDDLGIPSGSLVSFGGGSLSGTVTDNSAGNTVAFAGGMLTVNGNGSVDLNNPTMSGLFTFEYRLQNSTGSSDATVTVSIQGPPDGMDDSEATVLAGTSSPGDNNFHLNLNTSSNGVINVFANNGNGADDLGLPSAATNPPADVINNVMLAGVADGGTGTIGGGSITIGGTGSIEITTAGALNLAPPEGFTGLIEFDYALANSIGTDATPATVTVAVGARPVAMADGYNATGNIPINTTNTAGNSLLNNDTGDSLKVTMVQGDVMNVGIATATTNGGSIVVQTNGEFVYTPPTGFTGDDTFTYTAGNGFGNSTSVTVTITVSDLIYFMDDAATAGGDGSLAKPYKTISEHNMAPPMANSYLFIEDNGNAYSGNLTLVSGQTVIGEGTTGSLFGTMSLTGITLASLSNTVSYSTTGNSGDWAPIINAGGSAVTLNSGNTITGLSVGNRMTYAFADNGASVGSLSLKESEVTGTGGGVKIENGGVLDIDLSSLNTSGGAYGLWLNSTSGTVMVSGGMISNPTTSAITINGGGVNTTFTSSSITQSVNTNTVSVLGEHTGMLTYSGSINTTNGNGLQFNNADGQYNFNNTVMLKGGDAGIDIVGGSGGSFTFSNTTIANPSGTAFNVNNSSANISYLGGTITQNTNSSGVVINSNSSIVRLAAQLILSTGTNPAINVSGGGTIQMTHSNNTITTTTATAVTIDGTTITAAGVTLQDVSCDGATRAIYLNNAGPASGGFFTVTGTGSTDGSGGTIQNITNRGVEIVNTDMVILKNMDFSNVGMINGAGPCDGLDNIGCNAGIHGSQSDDILLDNLSLSNGLQIGINGKNINNWTLSNSTVEGFGDQVNEHGIYMRELTGSAVINNSTIRTSSERNVLIETASGTLNFVSNGSTYSESSLSLGADGLEFGLNGTTTATIDIDNCSFLENRSNGLQVLVEGTASVTQCDVTNTTFDPMGGPGIGIDLASSANGQLKFNVIGNPKIYSNGGPAINIYSAVNGLVEGRINDNPDIKVGGTGTSGSGIRVNINEQARGIVQVNNNTVGDIGNDIGIDAVSRLRSTGMGACGTGCTDGRLDVTITNNIVTVADPMLSLGIRTQAQEENTVCANVVSNIVNNSVTAYRTRTNHANATLLLEGFNTNATMTWDDNGNTPTTAGAVSESHSVGTLAGGTCTTPSNAMP